jgi:hypothetical protein
MRRFTLVAVILCVAPLASAKRPAARPKRIHTAAAATTHRGGPTRLALVDSSSMRIGAVAAPAPAAHAGAARGSRHGHRTR